MKLPSHTTVIAYLALFVALGGSAYAATQLPKNSVGSKQIKPNAVTASKLKNGAVSGVKIGANSITGANIDESTLGRVPSAVAAETAATAGHATTATNATHAASAASAADAKALGGVPGSDFLRTNAVQFNAGPLNACFAQTLAEVPGWFQITTVGDCKNEFKFTVKNLSAEPWEFMYETGVTSLSSGSSNTLEFGSYYVDLLAASATDPNKRALISCGYQQVATPARILCSTRISPAA